MKNEEYNILKPETQELLSVIEEIKKRIDKSSFKNYPLCSEFVSKCLKIYRAQKQFSTNLFFVVAFGPLKAGKSTLTNAIAGEYVSPSGFGKETTLRPSLVMRCKAGNEPTIEQYFSKDPSINNFLSQHRVIGKRSPGNLDREEVEISNLVQEAFDMVADEIRGLTWDQAEFDARIRCETRALNELNLEDTLTKDLPTEPLFTVIRCKEGKLLDSGVAVVDMPGLDGARSNWREDPIHEWVIKRAETFLFVQSSVAALNKETKEFVEKVIGQSTKPPIWLIQNTFDARYWQPDEVRKGDEKKQRDEGEQRIGELLGQNPRAVISLNLGRAWDGKKEGNPDWLAKSVFPEFEDEIVKTLLSEREILLERNSLVNLAQRIDEANQEIPKLREKFAEKKNEYEDHLRSLEDAASYFSATQLDYEKSGEVETRNSINNICTHAEDAWKQFLNAKIESLKIQFDRRVKVKDVNEAINELRDSLGKEGDECFKISLNSKIYIDYAQICDKFCSQAEEVAVIKCNELIKSIGYGDISKADPPELTDLPKIIDAPFVTQLKSTKKKIWWWIDEEHDGGFWKDYLRSLENVWKEKIGERKNNWEKALEIKHIRDYCEKRRGHYQNELQHLAQRYKENKKKELESIRQSEEFLDKSEDAIGLLKQPLQNAQEAMKRIFQ